MTACTQQPLARPIKYCRACGSSSLDTVFSLGPMHLSNFLKADDPDTPVAPLELVGCNHCMLLQLRHTVNADTLYRRFWYRSGVTASMKRAMADLACSAGLYVSLSNGDVVVDVGSNDGTLLRCWPKGLTRVGFDPAENLATEARQGGNLIVADYFSAKAYWEQMRQPAKVVTAAAMFYDVGDPGAFLRDIRAVLAHDGILVIQITSLRSMLDSADVGHVGHEHLAYYSLTTLCRVMQSNGFFPFHAEENDVNGGSIRVFAAPSHRGWSRELSDLLEVETRCRVNDPARWKSFETRILVDASVIRGLVKDAAQRGPVYVLGASTKGQTLLQFWDLNRRQIAGAAERDPAKVGLEMSAGRIPIVSEEEARRHARTFLVLPWHFRKEILEREKDWLNKGGRMIFPSPRVEEVGAELPEW